MHCCLIWRMHRKFAGASAEREKGVAKQYRVGEIREQNRSWILLWQDSRNPLAVFCTADGEGCDWNIRERSSKSIAIVTRSHSTMSVATLNRSSGRDERWKRIGEACTHVRRMRRLEWKCLQKAKVKPTGWGGYFKVDSWDSLGDYTARWNSESELHMACLARVYSRIDRTCVWGIEYVIYIFSLRLVPLSYTKDPVKINLLRDPSGKEKIFWRPEHDMTNENFRVLFRIQLQPNEYR